MSWRMGRSGGPSAPPKRHSAIHSIAGILIQPAPLLDDRVDLRVEARKLMLDNAWPTLRPLLIN